MTRHVYNSRRNFMQSFLNNPRSGMRYARARMFTRESPDGEGFQLVAYGNDVLAETENGSVDFYTAYHEARSETVTGYVKLFGSVLSNTEGYEVTIHDEAMPNTGIGNILGESAKFIDSYVGDFSQSFSAVEKSAIETVESACMNAFHELVGE